MKLIHLSDLHLGKRVNEFSMLEDQEYILKEILGIITDERPDGVMIAGDVYDKSVPSAEAVSLFDDFLVELSRMNLQVFIISGNHDSSERLSFGSRLMDASGIHLSPVYNGHVEAITLTDEYGEVAVYMLPFIKPANVRPFFPDVEIESYTDAVRAAIEEMHVDASKRNVIIAHQFVTGALSDFEDISLGGIDNVDASVFDAFDYAALGHIHRAQKIGRATVRYSGTPLKYSFSKVNIEKSVTIVEIGGEGEISLHTVGLTPRHDMREIRGMYDDLMLRSNYEGTATDDYLHITLTDEEDIPNAMDKLRTVYPNIMKLDYDNQRTRSSSVIDTISEVESKTPLQLFSDFYEKQNNQPPSEGQEKLVQTLIDKIWSNNN